MASNRGLEGSPGAAEGWGGRVVAGRGRFGAHGACVAFWRNQVYRLSRTKIANRVAAPITKYAARPNAAIRNIQNGAVSTTRAVAIIIKVVSIGAE